MAKKDSLRKLGIMRSGATSGTYKNAKERPTELQMDGVYDAEKDLVGGDKTSKKHQSSEEPPKSNEPPKNNQTPEKTNVLAITGLVLAFFLPLIGLVVSIVGLIQINKKKQKGKGLAIAGIIISSIVALLHLILTIAIIAAVFSSNTVTLTTYRDNAIGYSVKYPEKWTVTQQNIEGAKGVIIKDDYKNTGKVYGQVEVAYIGAPPNGYSKDVLVAIADSLKKSNPDTTVVYESRQTKNGLDTLTLLTTYKGETEKVKAKTTIILKKDNSVYTVSTQAPEPNWDKYQDSFDEIHNTFQTN